MRISYRHRVGKRHASACKTKRTRKSHSTAPSCCRVKMRSGSSLCAKEPLTKDQRLSKALMFRERGSFTHNEDPARKPAWKSPPSTLVAVRGEVRCVDDWASPLCVMSRHTCMLDSCPSGAHHTCRAQLLCISRSHALEAHDSSSS